MDTGLWLDPHPLVLASTSRTRRDLLFAAGLTVETQAPEVDERTVELGALRPRAGAAEAATLLAREKAFAVSRRRPGHIVIGADQTLAAPDGGRLSKPKDAGEAIAQITHLAGATHRLHSAAAVARDGNELFCVVDEARLTMRTLSPDFIARYVELAGPAALASVGGYQLEGLGVHLFSAIDGDHFTILGLPLLPLLDGLRTIGALAR